MLAAKIKNNMWCLQTGMGKLTVKKYQGYLRNGQVDTKNFKYRKRVIEKEKTDEDK